MKRSSMIPDSCISAEVLVKCLSIIYKCYCNGWLHTVPLCHLTDSMNMVYSRVAFVKPAWPFSSVKPEVVQILSAIMLYLVGN